MAKSKESIKAEIDHCLRTLGTLPVGSEEYKKAADNLKVLCEARSYKSESSIDWNVVLTCVTATLQIIMVMNHETVGVISTKAVGWMTKLRF